MRGNHIGSLRYDASGRKRKSKALNKCRRPQGTFKPMEVRSAHPNYEDRIQYKSAPLTPPRQDIKDDSYKKQISSKYTVSVAYNKGAYQVITDDNIKYIGK